MDFVLSLVTEATNPGPPYRCTVIGQPASQIGIKLLLVRVTPPFPDEIANELRTEILLAQRLQVDGETLENRCAWPIFVYVLLPNDIVALQEGRVLGVEDYRNYQWGELYPATALSELERIHRLPPESIWEPLSALNEHET